MLTLVAWDESKAFQISTSHRRLANSTSGSGTHLIREAMGFHVFTSQRKDKKQNGYEEGGTLSTSP